MRISAENVATNFWQSKKIVANDNQADNYCQFSITY